MNVAYVDTSVLVAVAFAEPGAKGLVGRLTSFDRLLASNLLEAEFQSALDREGFSAEGVRYLSGVSWILPNRPLTPEIQRVARMGYLRGADLWHLACALFISPDPKQISFLTLDEKQAAVAEALRFAK